jgi:5-methylcytosine-specific restriction protein A
MTASEERISQVHEPQITIDQFEVCQRPETYEYAGIKRYRDPNVRKLVLLRSGGVCELTGVPGFEMANGGIYLETHHIVPLSEGGPDSVENVIALSADAHRRVHYAINRDELRALCFTKIGSRTDRF